MDDEMFKDRSSIARKFYMEGKYHVAYNMFMGLAKIAPPNALPKTISNAAQTLYQMEDYEHAVELSIRLLSDFPDYARGYIVAVTAAISIKKWELVSNIIKQYEVHFGYTDEFYRAILKVKDIASAPKAIVSQVARYHSITFHEPISSSSNPLSLASISGLRSGFLLEEKPSQQQDKLSDEEFEKILDSKQSSENMTPKKKKQQKTKPDTKKEENVDSDSSFQLFQDLCKKAADAHLQGQQSLDIYKKIEPLLANLVASSRITANESILVTFVICMLQIDTGNYENIAHSVEVLQQLVDKHARFLPAIYALLSRAYYKLNRFNIGLEWAEKGVNFLAKRLTFSKQCFPQTTYTIPLTDGKILSKELNELVQRCKEHHPRDAFCRSEECLTQNKHIVPSVDIFFSDPNFSGYIELVCSNDCLLQYHPSCWKSLKQSLLVKDSLKFFDKEMLGKTCLTPDCSGVIACLEVIGPDALTKSKQEWNSSEPVVKERNTKRQTRKDSITDNRDRLPSLSKSPTRKPKMNNPPADSKPIQTNLVPHDVHQFFKNFSALSSNNALEGNIQTEHVNNKKPVQQITSYIPPVIITHSKKIQTDNILVDTYTQTNPCKLQARIDELTKTLQKSEVKYEKLRVKYVPAKENIEALEKTIKTIRGEERQKLFSFWKAANELIFLTTFERLSEKFTVLRIAQNCVNVSLNPNRSLLENVWKNWKEVSEQCETLKLKFQETCLDENDDTIFQLPSIPPMPQDIMPTLVNSLYNEITTLKEVIAIKQGDITAFAAKPQPQLLQLPSKTTVKPQNDNPPSAQWTPSMQSGKHLNTSLSSNNYTSLPGTVPQLSNNFVNLGNNNINNQPSSANSKDFKGTRLDGFEGIDGKIKKTSDDSASSKQTVETALKVVTNGDKKIGDGESNLKVNALNGDSVASAINTIEAQTLTPKKIVSNAVNHQPVAPLVNEENLDKGIMPPRKKTLSKCSSTSSLHSVDAFQSNENSGSVSVLSHLIHFIGGIFPTKSDDELYRSLKLLKQQNNLSCLTLEEVIQFLTSILEQNNERRSVLERFSSWSPVQKPSTSNQIEMEECICCMELLNSSLDNWTLPCSHIFHKECLENWLNRSRSCPICRQHYVPSEIFPPLS